MVTDKQRGMRRFAKGHGPKLRILINILEQRLIQEAAEHDNASIETTQIEEICHSLSEDISTLSNLVYQILDAYHNWDEQEEFQHKRKDVLGRLLVNEFEYMLEGRGGELPRIAISGILRSFRGLVGVEIFEELKITVNTLHQKITKEMGEGAPAVAIWKKFFAHPGAKLSLIRV
ncbi:MAG: hypothetical protein VYA34_02870, partial [Myxococcota bacterium]|nr:hypothetical protein [Myxococcota bacterium]